MDLLTILTTLDTTLNRRTISTKHDQDTVTWTKPTQFTVTYEIDSDETTITNCTQICLNNTNTGIKVYINHHNRFKLTSTSLADLTSFTIGGS